MPETDKKSSSTWSIVVILGALMAALGLQNSKLERSPSSSRSAANADSKKDSGVGSEEDPSNSDQPADDEKQFYDVFQRFLGRAHFSGVRSKLAASRKTSTKPTEKTTDQSRQLDASVKPTPVSDQELVKELRSYETRYLIACIPDPIDSRSGFRFDLMLETLQRAVEVHSHDDSSEKDRDSPPSGYILDQFYIPWQTPKSNSIATTIHRRLPGVLLFRDAYPVDEPVRLLVVFLVGESTTAGIQKEAMQRALNFVLESYRGQKPDVKPQINLLGPVFSGSQQSLQFVLQDTFNAEFTRVEQYINAARPSAKHPRKRHLPKLPETSEYYLRDLYFRVLSVASNLNPAEFSCEPAATFSTLRGTEKFLNEGQDVNGLHWSATLQSSSIKDSVLVDHLLKFIRERSGDFCRIAILEESNTGFGANVFHHPKVDDEPHNQYQHELNAAIFRAPFPAHINRIAAARKTLSKDEQRNLPEARQIRPRLNIPDDVEDGVTEMIPLRKPEMVTVVQEFALSQLLTTLNTERIQYILIRATDPRDKLFLAEILNEYCPDAQILLTGADLLYTHPAYYPYIGGALVASSYPISMRARHWGIADPLYHQIVFPDAMVQGYFNATLLLLDKDRFAIDYKTPDAFIDPLTTPRPDPFKPLTAKDPITQWMGPGVWISQVGYQQYHPVKFERLSKDDLQSGEYTARPQFYPQPRPATQQIPRELPPSWICVSVVLLVSSIGLLLQIIQIMKRKSDDDFNLDLLNVIAFGMKADADLFSKIVVNLSLFTILTLSVLVLSGQVVLASCTVGWSQFWAIVLLLVQFLGTVLFGISCIKCLGVTKGADGVLYQGAALICIVSAMGIGLSRILQFESIGDQRMWVLRIIELGAGSSPFTPAILMGTLFIAAGYTCLKCRLIAKDAFENASACERLRNIFDAGIQSMPEWYQSICLGARSSINNLSNFYGSESSGIGLKWHLAALFPAFVLLVEPFRTWQVGSEYSYFAYPLYWSFAAASLGILWMTLDTVKFWKLCEKLNSDVANLPLHFAWNRLPPGLVRDYATSFFSSRLRQIVPKYAQESYLRLVNWPDFAPDFAPASDSDNRQANATLQQCRIDGKTGDPSTPLTKLGLWNSAGHALCYLISQQPESKNRPPGSTAESDDKSKSEDSQENPAAGNFAEFTKALENHVAIAIVLFLSQLLLQLKQRAVFLVAATLLLLAAMISCPIQPGIRVLYVVGYVAFMVAGSLILVITGMNRDSLLSHITGTKPEFISFDAGFLTPMLFVLPLILVTLGQLPIVGPFLQSILAPIANGIIPK